MNEINETLSQRSPETDLETHIQRIIIYHESNHDAKGMTRYAVTGCPPLITYTNSYNQFWIMEEVDDKTRIPKTQDIIKLSQAIEAAQSS